MATNTDRVKLKGAKGLQVKLLSAVVAVGAGSAFSPTMEKQTFQVNGISTATVKIQVTNDLSNWEDSGLQFTADGIGSISGMFKAVRANVTAWSSGATTVTGVI
jgi:hypothetical protein